MDSCNCSGKNMFYLKNTYVHTFILFQRHLAKCMNMSLRRSKLKRDAKLLYYTDMAMLKEGIDNLTEFDLERVSNFFYKKFVCKYGWVVESLEAFNLSNYIANQHLITLIVDDNINNGGILMNLVVSSSNMMVKWINSDFTPKGQSMQYLYMKIEGGRLCVCEREEEGYD